jgi:cold shock CspA family protein
MIGTVRFFKKSESDADNRRTGFYGFIRTEAGDLFFHGSNCITDPDSLRKGEVVEFLLDDDPKGGLWAVDVKAVQGETE